MCFIWFSKAIETYMYYLFTDMWQDIIVVLDTYSKGALIMQKRYFSFLLPSTLKNKDLYSHV
jgi:hypothetical protein